MVNIERDRYEKGTTFQTIKVKLMCVKFTKKRRKKKSR